jgi:sarcosine oxidase subunit delta
MPAWRTEDGAMQVFPCPFCGPRPDAEFHYIGDADKPRPERGCSDEEWARYLLMRTNARGAARELWVHRVGCGRWLVVERDTETHEVAAVTPMNAERAGS